MGNSESFYRIQFYILCSTIVDPIMKFGGQRSQYDYQVGLKVAFIILMSGDIISRGMGRCDVVAVPKKHAK